MDARAAAPAAVEKVTDASGLEQCPEQKGKKRCREGV